MSILDIIHWLCLSFYFAYYCPSLVKIYDITQEEKEFLFFKKSQQIWELQNQKNLAKINDVSLNSALSLKKTFSIQFTYKEQSSHPVTHKGQSSIQSTHKEQSSYTVTHKRQFNIQFTHKKQSSHTVTHKKQPSTQSACQKQPSHLIIHQKQLTLAQAKQPSNPVIFKESFSIPAASEEPLSLISSAMKLDILNHIAQAI